MDTIRIYSIIYALSLVIKPTAFANARVVRSQSSLSLENIDRSKRLKRRQQLAMVYRRCEIRVKRFSNNAIISKRTKNLEGLQLYKVRCPFFFIRFYHKNES